MKKEPFFPQHETKFVHICHLLESLHLQAADKVVFSSDTQFNAKQFHELTDHEQETTFTGFFIKFLDYFVTVSPTYLSYQIKPLNFCKDFPCTGIINGIIKSEFEKYYKANFSNKDEAKKKLQLKYFNSENKNMIVFSFVGRYVHQKGIDILIAAIESLLKQENIRGKAQFLIGGYVHSYYSSNLQDVESGIKETIEKMKILKTKYPDNFWAYMENKFFSDGKLFNFGSNFGIVPSRYEPCGLVQQEYFVAETPVIATDEGGLHDTVFDDEVKMNGIFIKNLNVTGVEDAIKHAIDIYGKKEEHQKMCKNAKELCVDMMENTVEEYAFIIDRVARLGLFENEIEEKMEQMNCLENVEYIKK